MYEYKQYNVNENIVPLQNKNLFLFIFSIIPVKYARECFFLFFLNIKMLVINFNVPSTDEIRQDIEDAVTHLKPW